jgi:hypothetical protein
LGVDLERLLQIGKTAVAFKSNLGLELSLKVQSLADPGQTQHASQERQIHVIRDFDRRQIKIKLTTGADPLVEQEPNVDPQWMLLGSGLDLSQSSFQKSGNIITYIVRSVNLGPKYQT